MLYSVSQKELCNGIPNVSVWRVLRKSLHLKAYELSIIQHLEPVTQQYLEYHCKALFETACILCECSSKKNTFIAIHKTCQNNL
jgi:hypothetical protein